jgi:hypothetical protein
LLGGATALGLAGASTSRHLGDERDRIPVLDRSEDFILSSHVLEHLPNVIGAFLE